MYWGFPKLGVPSKGDIGFCRAQKNGSTGVVWGFGLGFSCIAESSMLQDLLV